jgi:formamidopyrimidine-DNA glycosylase
MPELPEVETIVRGLRRQIKGQAVTGIKVLYPGMVEPPPPRFNRALTNAMIGEVERRGKIILIQVSGNHTLLVRLGMTGRLMILPAVSPLEKHTHVIFELGPEKRLHMRYMDTRRFGRMALMETSSVSSYFEGKKLGREPLVIDEEMFFDLLSQRRGGVKALLLNQSMVCGIGNIYADEILHRARVHPRQEAAELTSSQKKKLYRAMMDVLTEAINKRGSSISDFMDIEGNRGDFQLQHRVYGRRGQPCMNCGAEIVREIVAGRGTCFCPFCQPLKASS